MMLSLKYKRQTKKNKKKKKKKKPKFIKKENSCPVKNKK